MKLPNTKVYRGGASQKLIYPKTSEVDLENSKAKTLEVRFGTNPHGSRKSAFLVEIGPMAYSVLLEHIAENIAVSSPTHAAILKAIAQDLKQTQPSNDNK
jgi:hypothetical protein